MKPYIEVADETAMKEMGKWNAQTSRSKLNALMDTMNSKQIQELLTSAQKIIEKKDVA